METLLTIAIAALALVCLGRSAVIAFFPDTPLADWCEHRLSVFDTLGDPGDGDGDCGGGD